MIVALPGNIVHYCETTLIGRIFTVRQDDIRKLASTVPRWMVFLLQFVFVGVSAKC